ncbi:general odorant-binding protein 69a-like [Ceratina calcarata]|uniref:General odorant-binding protein 69a-like n=1 Tax=Ceratina calcarata TaxID=156304 RepID=A0AAJ7IXE7_9HYME|nr:general odorant-binding protein 69a-like [Ceratina calcarata]
MGTKPVLSFLVLICSHAVFVAALPDWVPPEVMDMIADDKARCMGEHGTTQAQIDEVAGGKLENNPSITCYMYCLLEAFSLVDDEANIDIDMLMGILPENLVDKATTILNKCGSQATGADNCEKMFNLGKCVMEAAPELWFVA